MTLEANLWGQIKILVESLWSSVGLNCKNLNYRIIIILERDKLNYIINIKQQMGETALIQKLGLADFNWEVQALLVGAGWLYLVSFIKLG